MPRYVGPGSPGITQPPIYQAPRPPVPSPVPDRIEPIRPSPAETMTIAPAPRPSSSSSPAPVAGAAPLTSSSSGGGGGSTNWRDATYNEQIASINRALAEYESGAIGQGERYGTDYLTSLQRLGYMPGSSFVAMPNIIEMLNAAGDQAAGVTDAPAGLTTPVEGAFDIEGVQSPYSTAARGVRSLRDEFAARGGLQSTDFARMFGEFQNQLQEQLRGMETGRSRFAQDLYERIGGERQSAEDRRQQARRDAMQRAALNSIAAVG